MPEKLDRCVADLKAKGGADNPWAVCNASIGKEKNNKEDKTSEKPHKEAIDHAGDNANLVKGNSGGRINANRQVPVFNPPITNRDVKPKIDKTTKGIGGQVGKIDSSANTNNMTTDLWKKILDSQLRRNVKEPRY